MISPDNNISADSKKEGDSGRKILSRREFFRAVVVAAGAAALAACAPPTSVSPRKAEPTKVIPQAVKDPTVGPKPHERVISDKDPLLLDPNNTIKLSPKEGTKFGNGKGIWPEGAIIEGETEFVDANGQNYKFFCEENSTAFYLPDGTGERRLAEFPDGVEMHQVIFPDDAKEKHVDAYGYYHATTLPGDPGHDMIVSDGDVAIEVVQTFGGNFPIFKDQIPGRVGPTFPIKETSQGEQMGGLGLAIFRKGMKAVDPGYMYLDFLGILDGQSTVIQLDETPPLG